MSNPFELVTASKLSAEDAKALWSDDKRLERVQGKESCFINGHRGTGKSMLFRVLQYDCQKLLHPDAEPDFLSVYFSVRDSELMTEELALFQEDAQRNILSETHLALLILKQFIALLKNNYSIMSENVQSELILFIVSKMQTAFRFCTPEMPDVRLEFHSGINDILNIFEEERVRIVQYIGLRFYTRANFDGPLFLFDTLLEPLASFILDKLKKTTYILIDDGDDLPESHAIVLNTWIARRNTAVVFKVSTMFGYKTYQTRGRSAIQHPHDFIQYDIATRYLSDSSEDYISLLRDITRKRLESVGILVSPDDFFPEDDRQKRQLEELKEILMIEYSQKYSGRAVGDYVYRHLTSEYLKRYLIPGRSTHNFTYSGFYVIATLSSGLVRDFIICAQRMFDNSSRLNEKSSKIPQIIPPHIQNQVVRDHADLVLEEITNVRQKRAIESSSEDWLKVKRLVEGLASIFKAKMLSSDSERRVFSFAIQDEPPVEVDRLLDLAVSEGYLMKGFISRKEGTGRRILYVLTRRLAPAYNLDVTSYAGYMSLTSDRIKHLLEEGSERQDNKESGQMELFSDAEFIPSSPDTTQMTSGWVRISPDEAGL